MLAYVNVFSFYRYKVLNMSIPSKLLEIKLFSTLSKRKHENKSDTT